MDEISRIPHTRCRAVAAVNHYELLGLSPQASGQDLRQAFRSLSKLYHPDTTSLPSAEAEEAFRRVQQAYLTLSDPERRRAYDASLVPTSVPRPLVIERPVAVRRALSGGEWLALLLLALAVVFSLVLGVGLAWARGAEFMRVPSWWVVSGQTAQQMAVAASDDVPAAPEDAPLQPPAAPAGTLAA